MIHLNISQFRLDAILLTQRTLAKKRKEKTSLVRFVFVVVVVVVVIGGVVVFSSFSKHNKTLTRFITKNCLRDET